MKPDFLTAYQKLFASIQGAFQYDAALLFMAYNQLICAEGIAGNVLEIGVHHGLSSVAVATLRGEGGLFFAVDLFNELQSQNISNSGSGDKEIFLSNMKNFYADLEFMRLINCNSLDLKPDAFGAQFSFCHIDGGHSDEETYHDLLLCSEQLMPGGLVAIDDYFNPSFPGVCEGAVRFMHEQGHKLIPIAIGFNKVLFQKAQPSFNLNAKFSQVFSYIPKERAVLWGKQVNIFWSGFSYFFDSARSTPKGLAHRVSPEVRAEIEPQRRDLQAKPGEVIQLAVRIINKSTISFMAGDGAFGLSYHLLSGDGVMLQRDNARSFFKRELKPGDEMLAELTVFAPAKAGNYLIEIDIVWERVMWFQDKGNPTSIVSLSVLAPNGA